MNNASEKTPVGLIVGLVIGGTLLFSIIIVIAFVFYRKSQKNTGMYDRQLAMIDLTKVNLGEAKNSIVSSEDSRRILGNFAEDSESDMLTGVIFRSQKHGRNRVGGVWNSL